MTLQKNAGGDENSDSIAGYNPSYPVTWDGLIHIRVNGLSLDKYDEIRLRKTVPYQYEVGGCEWFNGKFLCADCIQKELSDAAKRDDVTISQYFMALGSKEVIF